MLGTLVIMELFERLTMSYARFIFRVLTYAPHLPGTKRRPSLVYAIRILALLLAWVRHGRTYTHPVCLVNPIATMPTYTY